MDVDAFADAHRASWERLEYLCDRRPADAAEVDEFLDLYQRTATHLSLVRSSTPDPYLVPYLSWLVARARARAHDGGYRRPAPLAFLRFFTHSFPAALYRLRWWWLAVMAASVLYMAGAWWWLHTHPEVLLAAQDEESVKRLLDREFVGYYSEYHSTSFFLKVFANNAWIGARLIVLGILGVPVLMILNSNLVSIAAMGAIHSTHGRVDQFFAYITPHGLLELTAIFVSGGVGLRLFWSWVEPGPRSRLSSLGEEGRRAVGVALGLVAVFATAAVVEAMVTPSGWPTPVRIGVGAIVEALFFAYVFVVGGRAARAGETGDVSGDAEVASLPVRG